MRDPTSKCSETEMQVNDRRIVRRSSVHCHNPPSHPWSLHMFLPSLEEKVLSVHTLQWNNLPAAGQPALELGGPSLRSQAFEMLFTALAPRHRLSVKTSVFFLRWLRPQRWETCNSFTTETASFLRPLRLSPPVLFLLPCRNTRPSAGWRSSCSSGPQVMLW